MQGAARSVLLPISLILLACLTSGCGSEAPPPTIEPTQPERTPEELRRMVAEADLKRNREKIGRIKERIQQDSSRFDDHLFNLRGLELAVEGTSLEAELKRLIVEQSAVREKFAMQRFESLSEEASKFVADGNFADAEITLSRFDPEESFLDTPAHKAWQNRLEEIQRLGEAENDYNRITRRARSYSRQEEYAKAIGLLETFSDEYKTTHYYPEIQDLIKEYFVIYREKKQEETATLSIEWVVLPVDPYLSSFRTYSDRDTEVWTADDDGVISATNGSDEIAQLEVGEDSWESYVVEFEAMVPLGQDFRIGVTSGIRPGQNIKNYDGHSLDLDTDDWVKVRVQLQDGLVSITDIENFENLDHPSAPYFPIGGMAIVLLPGEEVQLRNFRYKVYRGGDSDGTEEDEESDGESEEGSDGESEEDSSGDGG